MVSLNKVNFGTSLLKFLGECLFESSEGPSPCNRGVESSGVSRTSIKIVWTRSKTKAPLNVPISQTQTGSTIHPSCPPPSISHIPSQTKTHKHSLSILTPPDSIPYPLHIVCICVLQPHSAQSSPTHACMHAYLITLSERISTHHTIILQSQSCSVWVVRLPLNKQVMMLLNCTLCVHTLLSKVSNFWFPLHRVNLVGS